MTRLRIRGVALSPSKVAIADTSGDERATCCEHDQGDRLVHTKAAYGPEPIR